MLHDNDAEEALLTTENSPKSLVAGAAVSKVSKIEVAEETEATDAVAQSLHCVWKRLAWMQDNGVTWIHEFEDTTYFALFADCNPTTFESAINKAKWKNAMNAEIESVVKNDT